MSRRATAAQWRKLIERFGRSSQTRGNFRAANELAPNTFGLWRSKPDEAQVATEEAHSDESLLVELMNMADPAESRITGQIGASEDELGAGVALDASAKCLHR